MEVETTGPEEEEKNPTALLLIELATPALQNRTFYHKKKKKQRFPEASLQCGGALIGLQLATGAERYRTPRQPLNSTWQPDLVRKQRTSVAFLKPKGPPQPSVSFGAC